ncbi:MAG: hypothetical protein ACYTAF_00220, partial [Planctomycetota bacterium]|jgi:hypothetical protein
VDVDVRVARSPLDVGALGNASTARFRDRELMIVSPAFLGAMKVKAWSERKDLDKGRQDRADVAGLIAGGATTEEEIRAVLREHRPDLLAELDEMLRS